MAFMSTNPAYPNGLWGNRANPAGSRAAGTFTTPVQPGSGTLGSLMPTAVSGVIQGADMNSGWGQSNGPISQTTSPGMMGPNGPMIPPGPNQTTFAQQQANEASGATPTGQAPSGLPMQDRGELIANSPAYQFRFGQGQEAIERSAAARGTLLNGGTLKDLTSFGQGLASTEYDNEFRRLGDITRLGQAGAAQLGTYGSGYGNANMDLAQQQGNNTIGLGDASAAGTIAGTNATNQAGSVIANTAGQIDWSKLFKRNPSSSGLSA